MVEVQQQEQEKPNVIDISKFFGGKTLSSADIKVNKNETLKTKPSFIAGPELASLLDVVATSTEDKNNTIEKIKSVERIREREITERSTSDSTFRRVLSGLRFDIDSISKSYTNLIKSLESDRKFRAQEKRLTEDLEKQNITRLSKERVGASLVKPTQTIAGEETATEEQQQEEGFDIKKFLGATAAAAGLGAGSMFGGGGGQISESSEGSATQQAIYTYLTGDKGLSREHALGIMANIKAESGFRTNSKSGDDGGQGGLFQWKRPRSTAMAANVKDWETNWKGQIDYALQEDAGPSYLNQSFKTPESAARWWMLKWERPNEELSKPGGKRDKEHNEWIESFKPPETKTKTEVKASGKPQAAAGTPQAVAGTPGSSTVAASPPADTDPIEKSSAKPPAVATTSQTPQATAGTPAGQQGTPQATAGTPAGQQGTPQEIAAKPAGQQGTPQATAGTPQATAASSMKPVVASAAVASGRITPAEITSTKTGSQPPPIMISQSPPPRSSGGSYGDGESVGNVSVFSSTNPDNLYVAYALKELNIV